MAYSASTGLWTPDDPNGSQTGSGVPGGGLLNPNATPKPTSSVAANVSNDIAAGGPLLEAAKSAGMDYANSRGVLNSSIGAGAAQKATYDAVTPIATADAANITQKDLSAQGAAQSSALSAQEAAQSGVLQSGQLASQEKIAGENIGANQTIAKIQQQTQLQVANMNVASDQQDKAAAAAQGYANIYASMVNSINANTSIPADARDQYLQNAQTLYNNSLGLVEQTYNVSLDWGQGNSAVPAPAPAAPVAYTNPSGAQFDANGKLLGYAANSR